MFTDTDASRSREFRSSPCWKLDVSIRFRGGRMPIERIRRRKNPEAESSERGFRIERSKRKRGKTRSYIN